MSPVNQLLSTPNIMCLEEPVPVYIMLDVECFNVLVVLNKGERTEHMWENKQGMEARKGGKPKENQLQGMKKILQLNRKIKKKQSNVDFKDSIGVHYLLS